MNTTVAAVAVAIPDHTDVVCLDGAAPGGVLPACVDAPEPLPRWEKLCLCSGSSPMVVTVVTVVMMVIVVMVVIVVMAVMGGGVWSGCAHTRTARRPARLKRSNTDPHQ